MFAYDGGSDVWLCCRMTDGSVRSIGGVIGGGGDESSGFVFDFNPSKLPTDVTSPEQIRFEFIDTNPSGAPFPILDYTYQIKDFVVSGGVANYFIDIYIDGVRVSEENVLIGGESTPLNVSGGQP